MNIDVLRTFCNLVDTGSFSKAAELNYISQSAVSQQLAKLERELSVQLISRGGGLVAPTESGKTFYNGAREIIRRYEQLIGEVRSVEDSVRGVLRVGTIYSVGFYLLDSFVRKFLKRYPEVDLHMEYTQGSRIYAAVISGEMDLGVVACPEKHRSIEMIPLADEELVVAFSPKHRLAGKRTVTPVDLVGEKFVAFTQDIPTRRHIDKCLKKAGVKVDIAVEFDNIELLKRAISVEAGLSILPRENVKREVGYGELAYAKIKDQHKWVRPVGVIRHRGKISSQAEQMFLSILRGNKS